jgi:protein CMS1
MTNQERLSPDDLGCVVYEAADETKKAAKPKKTNAFNKKKAPLNTLSPQEMADFLVSAFGKIRKDLSPLELNDLKPLPTTLTAFCSPNSSDVSSCIKTLLSDWKKVLHHKQQKLSVVIISSSAIRATELIKQLAPIRVQSGIGKCFAKHFKIQEQLKFFDTFRPAIAIGTPNRLLKLFESGHPYFSLEHARLCIIDTHCDVKERDIFGIPETCSDLLALFKAKIRPALSNGCKMVFF